MKTTINEDFINFYKEVGKTWGLDTLSSTLLGMLYIEPEDITLEELAKKTGYSLASISNKMRVITNLGIIERKKKPGSKKIYFYMSKDCIQLSKMHFEKLYQIELLPAKETLPKILAKYKDKKLTKNEKITYTIIHKYYKQINKMEKIYKKMIKYLDEIK